MKEIHLEISDLDNKHEVCEIILTKAIDFIKFSTRGSLLLINEDGLFEYVAIKGYPEELKNLRFQKEELYLYKINNFKEPAILTGIDKLDKGLLNEMKYDQLKDLGGFNIKSTISFPIHVNGEVIAIMNLDSERVTFEKNRQTKLLYEQIKYDLNSIFENYNVREKLTQLANIDELTGLLNKRLFKKILESEIEILRKSLKNVKDSEELYLIFMDIDNFKNINDEKGHYFGDMALRYFANLLKEYFSENVVSRIYGDEFAILCRGENICKIGEKIDSLKYMLQDCMIKTNVKSFSYGIIKIDENNLDKSYETLMHDVDELMYKDKKDKKLIMININEYSNESQSR
ncbi:sensor domain-containing diguanylate cyclase [Oceanirhabdus seepicola]|uniref:Sensor domain-containing diguanylate cyclase n=1 Tax=Oceanirhabdus seepicola TaxID=2828781 RepID=A0A9J6P2Z2_9CLOT|nr:sensor domain-containing diguanylate cyclase [Oceanirhabdus seepicola]MCM1989896.1 sensor domain-containing diguanylate cyclase [Oceanirhabdus seepicola]